MQPAIRKNISTARGIAVNTRLAGRRDFLQRMAALGILGSLPSSLLAQVVTREPTPSRFGSRSTAEEVTEGLDLAGLIGIGTITGRIVGGFLLDHIDGRFVAVGCGVAATLMAAVLLATDQSVGAAMAGCFFLGLAAGAEYDACAYLTTRHFPRRNFGALFGLIGALSGVGAGISPLLANAIYDVTLTYQTVLWGIFPLFIVASILFLMMGPYPDEADLV